MKACFCVFLAALFLVPLSGEEQEQFYPSIHVKKFVAPIYPARARQARIMGKTNAELQIRADGAVDSVKVVMAYPMFTSAVETALKQWTFDPIPKSTTLKINVKFWLEECDERKAMSGGETLVVADLPDNVEVRTCIEPTITNIN